MSSPLTEKQQIERKTFDLLVREKTQGKSLRVPSHQPSFADYNGDLFWGALRHVRIPGKRILEIGCGSGELSTWFALQGARSVFGVDISEESIRIARERAEENNVTQTVEFFCCPGESMPFPDQSFDVIFINVTLHHLELSAALQECERLLAPSGLLVAIEPFVRSDLIQKIRESRLVQLLYPIRRESITEKILDKKDVEQIRQSFPSLTLQPHRVFSPFLYKIKPLFHTLSDVLFFTLPDREQRRQRCNAFFQNLDEKLLWLFPPLALLSRYSILVAKK